MPRESLDRNREALARLPTASRTELSAEWQRLYRTEPPARLGRQLLIAAIAYRLQEQVLGGIRPELQRRLRHIAEQGSQGGEPIISAALRLKPGTRLLREWQGRTHEVLVSDDGFVWQQARYRSLSQISRAITGTSWSGPVFWPKRSGRRVAPMPRAETPRKRCGIYTRKSSEEGLEQEFNSLHAQREACEAYIRSQRHEGWVALPAAYDDGGFSGGNLQRPGLQRLLADVCAGRVDVIVTYKVDRLTRSLADFARLIEILDAHHVSFVSVTQQFNTTSSMGRLTLNVLLSFAQFEREVTGERIRDKIAASKKKGMWMGGNPPLGYDAHERKLVLNPAEAETVRSIFALYLELGCVRRLKDTVDRRGWITKRFTTAAGHIQGGRPISRGHLYRILANPIYLGRIAHKGQLHPGQHEALIEAETWEAVQAQLAANTAGHRRRAGAVAPSLFAGLLVDSAGERLTPSHAAKNGRRYRYYISRALIAEAGNECKQGWRLPAHDLEEAVIGTVAGALRNRGLLLDRFGMTDASAEQVTALLDRAGRIAAMLDEGTPAERAQALRDLVERIVIGDDTLAITLRRGALISGEQHASDREDDAIGLVVPLQLRRRGVEMKLVIPGEAHRTQPARPDPAVIKAVARGHLWFHNLATGRAASLRDIAEHEGITEGYVGRLIRLAFLAPCMVEAILQGTQPVDLTAARLTGGSSLPLDWSEQHRLFFG